jgi:hypothetical protein
VRVIRGSHLYRETTSMGRTDAEVAAGWCKGKLNPQTGAPLRPEALALPPGSIVCCHAHAAHGVSPRDGGAAGTRWCSLFAYRNVDRSGQRLYSRSDSVPEVWERRAAQGMLPARHARLLERF